MVCFLVEFGVFGNEFKSPMRANGAIFSGLKKNGINRKPEYFEFCAYIECLSEFDIFDDIEFLGFVQSSIGCWSFE